MEGIDGPCWCWCWLVLVVAFWWRVGVVLVVMVVCWRTDACCNVAAGRLKHPLRASFLCCVRHCVHVVGCSETLTHSCCAVVCCFLCVKLFTGCGSCTRVSAHTVVWAGTQSLTGMCAWAGAVGLRAWCGGCVWVMEVCGCCVGG